MSTASLLESCADMVLACSDGARIPCVRFQCLTTCDVIRHVMEDVALQKDERGRAVVPFPGVDSGDLRAATEVLHDVRPVDQLGADDVPRALRGLRALGHDALTPKLLQRYWALVHARCSYTDLQPHVSDLVRAHGIRTDVLRRLVQLCPVWLDFSDHVLPDLDVTLELARWLLPLLTHFFPAGPLFVRVLDLLETQPLASVTPGGCLELFSDTRNASAYHPAEAMDAAAALADLFRARRWDASTLAFLEGLQVAGRVFDVAPYAANTMHGTIVLVEHMPTASLLLEVLPGRRRGGLSRKMAPWLWLWVDWDTGEVDARVTLARLDDGGRRASTCQVRLTAYGRDEEELAEVWHSAPIMPTPVMLPPFTLREHTRLAAGDEESLRGLVRGGDRLARLRVDLFYGQRSVLDKPCL